MGNRFQLTETGKYPLNLGFLLEFERPQNRAEGYEVKWGPLLQTDIGKTTWNANFLFKRSYYADESSRATSYYQVQGNSFRQEISKYAPFGRFFIYTYPKTYPKKVVCPGVLRLTQS